MSGIWFYENWHKSAAVLAKKTELREAFKQKKMSNLGFWLKLGGGGV